MDFYINWNTLLILEWIVILLNDNIYSFAFKFLVGNLKTLLITKKYT